MREITAVAIAPDGSIYATPASEINKPLPCRQFPCPFRLPHPRLLEPLRRPRSRAPLHPLSPGGSEIYHIQADGYPRKIWSHAQDLVYALAFDAKGRVIAGTGNHGDIYRLDDDHKYWKLVSLSSTQVTAFCTGPAGKLFVATGNIGKIFSVGPELEQSGTLGKRHLRRGRLFLLGSSLALAQGEQRRHAPKPCSGNLNRAQKNWSAFARTNAGRIVSPPARFLQYRLTLTGSGEVTEIDAAYQMKNVAPEIEEIEVTPLNYKFPAPSSTISSSNPSLTLPALGRHNASPSSTAAPASEIPARLHR